MRELLAYGRVLMYMYTTAAQSESSPSGASLMESVLAAFQGCDIGLLIMGDIRIAMQRAGA